MFAGPVPYRREVDLQAFLAQRLAGPAEAGVVVGHEMALAFRTRSRQTLYVTAKDPSGLLSPEDNIAAEVGQLETSLRQGRAVKFSHERNAALSANQPTPTRPARITKCHNPSRQFRDAEKPRRNLVDFFFNMAVHQSPLLPGARRGRRLRMQGSRALITADLWTIPDDRSPPTSCRRRGRG